MMARCVAFLAPHRELRSGDHQTSKVVAYAWLEQTDCNAPVSDPTSDDDVPSGDRCVMM